jgi:hypothetical protein
MAGARFGTAVAGGPFCLFVCLFCFVLFCLFVCLFRSEFGLFVCCLALALFFSFRFFFRFRFWAHSPLRITFGFVSSRPVLLHHRCGFLFFCSTPIRSFLSIIPTSLSSAATTHDTTATRARGRRLVSHTRTLPHPTTKHKPGFLFHFHYSHIHEHDRVVV